MLSVPSFRSMTTLMRALNPSFNLPSRRHAYWTNLHKFQLIENDGDSVSISKLPSKDIMTMIHMQRELFLAEIKDTKPDIIIYFTGGQTSGVRSLSKQW